MLTPEQVAKRLQVQERTILDWLRSGQLRGLKLGRLWRIEPADLQAFLSAAARGRDRATTVSRRTPSRRRTAGTAKRTGPSKRGPRSDWV